MRPLRSTTSRARRTLTFLALAAVLATLAAPAANASPWWCNGNSMIVPVGAAGVNVAYVTIDSVFGGYAFSVWVYAETNGLPDLQRGGKSLLFGDEDPCQDHPDPDQIVF